VRVPLVDLVAQHASIRDDVMRAAAAVIDGQSFILGEPVARFERALAAACETSHAIGVASGSDALMLALRAAGVGEGDCVVTTAFTFVATAEAIVRAAARPIFADIDGESMNLSPTAVNESIARAQRGGLRVRAILPVHLFGRCADMEAIGAIAREHGLVVIEDAAQAIGARDAKGRRAGAMGAAGCFSFFPTKNVGAWGDGGAVTTSDRAIDARIRRLRQHGAEVKGELYAEIGLNSRLDALHAAVLDVKLAHLEVWTRARRRAAARYRELLAPLSADLALPHEPEGTVHAFNQFVVRTPQRDALARHLSDHGVATRAYYPHPLHAQPCFAPFCEAHPPLPETDRASATSLALPMFAEITEAQQGYVVETIRAYFRQ
jgi:dTDP-4-amino-4,6-dideoxygalactose transaminase